MCAAPPTPTPTNDCSCYILEATAQNSIGTFQSGPYGLWTIPSNGAHAVEVDCLAINEDGKKFARKKFFAVVVCATLITTIFHENTADFWQSGLPGVDFYLQVDGSNGYSVVLEETDGILVNAKARFTYIEMV